MADSNISISKVIEEECRGSKDCLSNDPADPGGLTRYGIALKRHPEFTRDDILNMTEERAIEIYRKQYWTTFLDQVDDQTIADYLFDIRVNQGAGIELSILQNALQAVFIISGANLITLTNGANPVTLLSELRARRAVAYHQFLSTHPNEEKVALGLFRRACR